MPKASGTKARTKRPHGLPRPKTTASFQWHPPPTTPSPATNTHTTTSLSKQTHILALLIRRNRNQHRSQPFFKHLHVLQRALIRLHDIHTALASTTSASAATSLTAEKVRRRFEAEASLRTQRDVWEGHIREIIVPQCYVAFGALVADTQFANLGVVLIGVLADVFALVGGPKVSDDDDDGGGDDDENNHERLEVAVQVGSGTGEAVVVQGTSMRATGEDWGEVVERVYEAAGSDGGEEERVIQAKEARVQDGSAMVDDVPARHRQAGALKELASKHSVVETDVKLEGKGSTNVKSAITSEQKYNDEEDSRPRKKKKKGKSAIDDLFAGLI